MCSVSGKDVAYTVCGFWRYKFYADIRRGSLVRRCQMRVRSSKMRVFYFDRYIFRVKFPTGFAYRNLHGFARFPCDSTGFVTSFPFNLQNAQKSLAAAEKFSEVLFAYSNS